MNTSQIKQTYGKDGSPSGPSGIVKSVYESDSHYHMKLINPSSTKSQTPGQDSLEAADADRGLEKEFKFKKVDLYLE